MQEFCEPGYWLQLDSNYDLQCTVNPCLNTTGYRWSPAISNLDNIQDEENIVLYEGKCVLLASECQKYKRIGFYDGNLEPTCGSSFLAPAFVGGGSLASLDCTKRGSRWSYATGMCKQTVSYKLSR